MRKRQIITAAAIAAALAMPAMAGAAPAATLHSEARAAEQKVDLVSEDFSKMTAGSESNPDLSFNINTYQGEPSDDEFFSGLNSAYTHEAGWGSYQVYPAGGMIYFHNTRANDYWAAHINTPLFDASGNSGVFFLKFRARLVKPNPQYAGLGLRVTDWTDADNISYIKMDNIKGLTDQWQEFTVRIDGGTKKTRVMLCEEYGYDVLLDDIEIYQAANTVATPTVLRHLYYNGTSFRPRWNKVEGATKYFVNVYQSDADGNIGEQVITDLETTDTICTVRGITPGVIYRYTVTASDGTQKSIPSRYVELNELVTPSLNEVDNYADGKYTATWSAVPGAKFYNYYVYAERKAEQDGEFTLFDEDFNSVTDSKGQVGIPDRDDPTNTKRINWEPGEEDDLEYLSINELGFPKGLKMQGYYANNWVAMKSGFIMVDGWNYFYDVKDNISNPDNDDDVKEYGKFETPVLNFSEGGKVKLKASIWGKKDTDEQDKSLPKYQTNAIAAIIAYDAATGQYEEVERKHFDLKEQWTDVECEFDKGYDDARIVIYACDGPAMIYIDNLKVTQEMKKGDTFATCVACDGGFDKTSVKMTIPAEYANSNLYHRLVAVTEHSAQIISRTYYYFSGPSELELFHEGNSLTAINDATTGNATATEVARYAIDGTRLSAPKKGVNIVKMSDGTTRKVVVE